jgi:tetratricopeptide (TPR) repeat protein
MQTEKAEQESIPLWTRVGMFAVIVMIAINVGTARSISQDAQAIDAHPHYKTHAGFAGHYLAARFAAQHRNLSEAAKHFERSLVTDPYNIPLLSYTLRAHLLAGDVERAAWHANTLLDLKQDQPIYRVLLAVREAKNKQFAKANTWLAPVKEQAFGNFNDALIPLLQGWLTIANEENPAPFERDLVPQDIGELEAYAQYLLATMNDVAGHSEEAGVLYRQATSDIEIVPYRMIEMLGNYYTRQGEAIKAEALYRTYNVLQRDSDLGAMELDEHASPILRHPRDGLAEVFFATGSLLFSNHAPEETHIYLRLALYLRPDFPIAQLMMANLLEQRRNYEEAFTLYQSINLQSPLYKKAQVRAAFSLSGMKKKEEALEMLREITRAYPDYYEAHEAMGDMYRINGQFHACGNAYSKAIDVLESVEPEHWKVIYARGICFERGDKWKKAEADFLHALKLEPGQPDVMNYLGYSWLVRAEQVDRAKRMLEQAVAQRPEDAHIVDSIGWAYYVTGNFIKAKQHLEKAVALVPSDPTIYEHLGDVYWRLGREVEARYMWERAIVYEPEREALEGIQVKLENGMESFVPATSLNLGAKPRTANDL